MNKANLSLKKLEIWNLFDIFDPTLNRILFNHDETGNILNYIFQKYYNLPQITKPNANAKVRLKKLITLANLV